MWKAEVTAPKQTHQSGRGRFQRHLIVPVLRIVFLLSILQISVLPVAAAPTFPAGFKQTPVVTGLNTPTKMTFAPDGRIFISEKDGLLRVFKADGQPAGSGTFLDLTQQILADTSRGLFGVAFDPNFGTNRQLYVYYTSKDTGVNRISQFKASSTNPNQVEAGSEVFILDVIGDPGWHNAGDMKFGPIEEGGTQYLYVPIGDGHPKLSLLDPKLLTNLNGKLLRIDPSKYPNIIPPGNPYVGNPDTTIRKEIWARGLRNAYNIAFDPPTNRLYINDVGIDDEDEPLAAKRWEEINLGIKDANYGWNDCSGACSQPGLTDPIHTYNHAVSAVGHGAIVGGVFYRGTQFPAEYSGDYFFGDFEIGFINRLKTNGTVVPFATGIPFLVDLQVGPADGSLYYLSFTETGCFCGDGALYKIEKSSAALTVASVTPNKGPVAGGTPVTIAETGFVTGATATFGGMAATSVIVTGATSITATTPAHAAGAVEVAVTNPGAPGATLSNGFTFNAAPTVTSVTPNNGPAAGGTVAAIAGTGFVTGATVVFGGTPATSVIVASATSITATTPPHAAGVVSVVVTNPGGESGTLSNGFTFNPGPGPGSVNLLQNASFEIDTDNNNRPDIWTSNRKFTRSVAIAPRHGTYIGRLNATDNQGLKIIQTVNVNAGTTYFFSCQANMPSTADSFTFKFQVQWRKANDATISTSTLQPIQTIPKVHGTKRQAIVLRPQEQSMPKS